MSDEGERINVSVELAGPTEEDWRLWRVLDDYLQQLSMLRKWHRELPEKGIFVNRFLRWFRGSRWYAMAVSDMDEGKAERVGELDAFYRLRPHQRAEALCEHMDGLGVFHVFEVHHDDGHVEYYIALGHNNRLVGFEDFWSVLVLLLYGELVSREALRHMGELLRARATTVHHSRVNPPQALRVEGGVLDLETLAFSPVPDDRWFFTYHVPLYTQEGLSVKRVEHLIKVIKEGSYVVEANRVYQAFRSHFDEENWRYLIDALGVVLSPRAWRLLVFLVGPEGVGKSTLLRVIARPIEPVVAWLRLGDATSYTFGLEPLYGKQVVFSTERGITVVRRIDLLNSLFGESDRIPVYRKYKGAALVSSLKLGIIAMNSLPLFSQQESPADLSAFADRLSIIYMQRPEGFEPKPGFADTIPAEDAFAFLLWCRWQLEQKGWRIGKLSKDEVLETITATMNNVLGFLDSDEVVIDPDERAKGVELYAAYKKWCEQSKLRPLPLDQFYSVLRSDPRFKEYRRDKSIWFKGIGLRRREDATYELERFG
jgi:phage/plasmid-associated DNA primase